MTEHMRSILEHMPFVMATGVSHPQLDLKDLVGAIIIGVISAIGSSYITTKEMAVEMRILSRQTEQLSVKLDAHQGTAQQLGERITRLEEKSVAIQQGMSGMGGANGSGRR